MRRDDILKVSGVSSGQRATWSACAAAAGLPSAAWMREAAAAAASGTIAADLRAELVRLRADLARGMGNNLNQIAHAPNADLKAGRLPDATAHERSLAAAADVALARRAVERMLLCLERPTGRATGRVT